MNCFDELGMDPLSTTGRLTGVSNSALMCSAFLRIERCVMAAWALNPKAPKPQSPKAPKPQSPKAQERPLTVEPIKLSSPVIGPAEMAE